MKSLFPAAARYRGIASSSGIFFAFLLLLGVADPAPAHEGKVLIIRGRFTVFSLGLDKLGSRLRDEGLDVEVIPAFWADVSTARIRDEYLSDPEDARPIVIIGHSLGGDLAPEQARDLQENEIPVELVVIIDTTRASTIPSNVRRCVNIYRTNALGLLFSGDTVSGESRQTEIENWHVDELSGREGAGLINHFNIDSHDLIHAHIVKEVLLACPPAPASSAATAPAITVRVRTGLRKPIVLRR